jgi:hypothetical protein
MLSQKMEMVLFKSSVKTMVVELSQKPSFSKQFRIFLRLLGIKSIDIMKEIEKTDSVSM